MVNLTIIAGGYTAFFTTYIFNSDAPSLTIKSVQEGVANRPSWISRPAGKDYFYAAEENWPGSIKSVKVDANGVLSYVDRVASGGNGPAYVGTTPSGEVLALNFNSGTGRSISLNDTTGLTFNTTFKDLTFEKPLGGESNPHHFYSHGNTLLVADLGGDKVWQLQRNATLNDGTYNIIGFYNETKGSGPRRAIGEGDTLWVLHELDNTLTERTLPVDGRASVPTISSVVTIPAGRDSASESGAYHAAELLRPKPNTAFPTEYLYVSNRAIKIPDPLGDTIAIFSTKPLKKVGEVHTGLNQIRGMEFGGENDKYLIAGGNAGGGVVVYERLEGGKELKLLARNWEAGSVQRTTFIWW